jgi:hypothetical protein
MSIGHFPIVPFCFAAIGDLFDPSERSKWTGLLNLPGGVAALRGPQGVVDFIDIGLGDMRWPTFNVADMAVSTGAILLAIVLWGEEKAERRSAATISPTGSS